MRSPPATCDGAVVVNDHFDDAAQHLADVLPLDRALTRAARP